MPFATDEEKNNYIKQLNKDDNDENDAEDEMNEPESQVIPEGKYETRVFEFEYVPLSNIS